MSRPTRRGLLPPRSCSSASPRSCSRSATRGSSRSSSSTTTPTSSSASRCWASAAAACSSRSPAGCGVPTTDTHHDVGPAAGRGQRRPRVRRSSPACRSPPCGSGTTGRARSLSNAGAPPGHLPGLFASFVAVGVMIATLFGRRSDQIGRLYFADLARRGAGVRGGRRAHLVRSGLRRRSFLAGLILALAGLRIAVRRRSRATALGGVLAVVLAVGVVAPSLLPHPTRGREQDRPERHHVLVVEPDLPRRRQPLRGPAPALPRRPARLEHLPVRRRRLDPRRATTPTRARSRSPLRDGRRAT